MKDESCFALSEIHQLLHPLHPHPLQPPDNHHLSSSDVDVYVCDGCNSTCPFFVFHCKEESCDFKLDVQCALSLKESQGPAVEPTTIQHFLDPHGTLRSFYCRLQLNCEICSGSVTGLAYGCVECKTALHVSCAEYPQEILQHPYHPQHPLRVHVTEYEEPPNSLSKCMVCRSPLSYNPLYQCLPCGLALHMDCFINLFSRPL
ncbi:hypothetical protein Tsubulata_043931 [Turnera subulata]|uniref:DC1 domain-containing protein n=1 Tax=Turnera subulata TaxID=218843 RepID=A0A9Q0FXU3_9ROSI|nr:hypothetical protein Tsubulata_043931 [Turnera subulata]